LNEHVEMRAAGRLIARAELKPKSGAAATVHRLRAPRADRIAQPNPMTGVATPPGGARAAE
jgi:hypothetical protein